MSANERRALLHEGDQDFDCSVQYDVNEYLIEHWPTLNARGRKSVWTLAQEDDEFDWSSVEEQIDAFVYQYAESATDWDLPEEDYEEDESDEEDDTDITECLYLHLPYFFECSWPELTEEQVNTAIDLVFDESIDWEPIYEQLDAIVYAMAEDDDTIVLEEEDDETTEESTDLSDQQT